MIYDKITSNNPLEHLSDRLYDWAVLRDTLSIYLYVLIR